MSYSYEIEHYPNGSYKKIYNEPYPFFYLQDMSKVRVTFCHCNFNGEIHNINGPALMTNDNEPIYYIHGIQYKEELFKRHLYIENLDKIFKTNKIS